MADGRLQQWLTRARALVAPGADAVPEPEATPYALDDVLAVAELLAYSDDHDERMHAVCRAAARVAGAHRGTLLLRHQGSYQRSWSAGPAGTPAIDRAPPVLEAGDSLVERLHNTPGVLLLRDSAEVQRLAMGRSPAGAVGGLAVKAPDGKPVGLVLLEFAQARPELDGAQVQALLGLAAVAAQLQRGQVRALAREEAVGREHEQTRRRLEVVRGDAMADLAEGTGHELSALLTVLGGYLQLLGNEDLPPVPRLYLERLHMACDRAATLAADFVHLAGADPVAAPVVDVNKLLGDLMPTLERDLPSDVAVEFSPARGVRCHIHPDHLEHVVTTLTGICRDAMPDGGRLTIATEGLWLNDARARELPGLPAGDYVLVSVGDTGDGLAPELLARVFEPFAGIAGRIRGGLGRSRASGGTALAGVRGLVRSAGGDTLVRSAPGVGTTWEVLLPRTQEQPTRDEPLILPARIDGDETVLLCDDDATVLELMAEALRARGYRVVAADQPGSALALAARQGSLDVLVCDLVLPGGSGQDLLAEVRERFPDLPVVWTAGHSGPHRLHRTTLEEDALVLVTPYTPEDLVRRVRHALNRAKRG